MKITFDNPKLEKQALDLKKCEKELGKVRAKLLNKRLGDLHDAETLEDLRHVPGKYHELIGDRKGQWSCALDGPYRLIFTPKEDPIPTDTDGKYIWQKIKGVIILEITNYHGK